MQDLDGLKPERLDAVEDPLAGAEQDRRDVERELVDDPGNEGLAHSRGATRDVYAALAGRLTRLCVSGVEAVGDEVEGRPAFHLDRLLSGMGGDQNPGVGRRLGGPPAPPAQSPSPPPRIGPNIFRPMTYAPRGRMSQPVAVASASLARSSPRCQPWSSRPRLPSGSTRLWSGPATKPSSEIDMWQVVSGIGVLSDGARGTRTPDLLGAIQALSQLSYSPEEPRSVPGRRLATVVSNGEYAACQG